MLAAEIIASWFHMVTDSFGMIGNGLLTYLAIFKSPPTLKVYSILLTNFGITDFCCSLLALFVEQRVIPIGWTLAFISSGPCKYFGSNACYIGLAAMSHFYSHAMWSLFLSFLYRYYVLRFNTSSRRMLMSAIGIVYLPSLFQFITFTFASDPPETIQNIVRKNFPEYNITAGVFSGTVDIRKWTALFTILHMTVPLTIMYIIIIFVRRSIIKIITETNMSFSTKAMHKQLLRALTFQALLPVVYFFSVITYLLEQLSIYHHPILEYATFTVVGKYVDPYGNMQLNQAIKFDWFIYRHTTWKMAKYVVFNNSIFEVSSLQEMSLMVFNREALYPCISPVGTLFFIKPYNNWIRGKFQRSRVIDRPTGSSTFRFPNNT